MSIPPFLDWNGNTFKITNEALHVYVSNEASVIQHDQKQLHDGKSFLGIDNLNVNSTTQKWMFEVDGANLETHCVFSLSCTGEAVYIVSEGADRLHGTNLPIINKNRKSATTSQSLFSRTPTSGTTDGTPLFTIRTGETGLGSKLGAAGNIDAVSEWILNTNTKYIISIQTFADVYVTAAVYFSEESV